MSYGYCPNCGAPGERRERRPNGNDTCANGCVYPSKDAVDEPKLPNWAERAQEAEKQDQRILDLENQREEALDLLNGIREHHERLNREAGRPLERSNTIRMVKEVIAALTREDKPQALTDVERSVGILKRWISDRIDRVRADAIEKINAGSLDLSPERNTEEALLKLRHDLEHEWNR